MELNAWKKHNTPSLRECPQDLSTVETVVLIRAEPTEPSRFYIMQNPLFEGFDHIIELFPHQKHPQSDFLLHPRLFELSFWICCSSCSLSQSWAHGLEQKKLTVWRCSGESRLLAFTFLLKERFPPRFFSLKCRGMIHVADSSLQSPVKCSTLESRQLSSSRLLPPTGQRQCCSHSGCGSCWMGLKTWNLYTKRVPMGSKAR